MSELPVYNCPFGRFGESVLLRETTGDKTAKYATRLSCSWDDDGFIARFECEDPDPAATYENRDDPLYEEEVCEAFLCPSGDIRYYFEFEINPLGTLFDATVFSPDLHRGTMQTNTAWDAEGLMASVVTTEEGWYATLYVPFSDLGCGTPQPGEKWRANFYRIDREGEGEYSAWSPTLETPANFHVPAHFGTLRFVAGE